MGLLDVLLRVFAPIIDYIALNHRAAAMMLVVLPLSYVTCLFIRMREWVARQFLKKTTHEERVKRVEAQVKARHGRKDKKPMCTARAAWQNLSTRFATYKKNSDCIFIADFNQVLELDEEALTVTLEPLADVDAITKYLVPKGYMLATTLEIKEATIGGLAMAVGMTTASHKYGLLSETVLSYEVILSDGKVVTVTKDNEHSDLFYAIPWSHGSLCMLLSLKMKVIKVTPWVELKYTPVHSGLEDYCKEIKRVSLEKDPADFVEATIFSRQQAVVMTANFVDAPDAAKGKTNRVGLWYKPWFYTHIRAMLQHTTPQVEYIPTYDYIFRHDRAIFFTLDDQLPEAYGNHPLFRYLFGWLCPPKVQFLKMPATPTIRKEMMTQRVYQDIVLPIGTMEEAVAKAADLFEIWPILIYPSRIYDHGEEKQGQFRKPRDVIPGTKYGMYYDLGVYGIPRDIKQGKPCNTVSCMREMEDFTRRVGGAPFLYADTFMDKDEFSEMFDLRLYEKMRTKYNAEGNFVHLYDKTSGCQSFDWREIVAEEPKEAKKLK